MRLHLLAPFAVLLTGCGELYETVPVYGESDPNQLVDTRIAQIRAQAPQGSVAAISAAQPVEVGQNVDVSSAQPPDTYSDTDPSALTDFHATLDPYGSWADDATYGTVWQPDSSVVGADFQPYVTAGHWDYANDDYVWQSDYDWGWAPFHYGRWTWIAGRGWCWIPGRSYAGAWVSWRTGAPGYGYVGWGPMAPTWGWRNGAVFGLGAVPRVPYTFCGTGDLFAHDLHGRTVHGNELNVVGGNTRPWNDGRTAANPNVSHGPPPSRIGATPPPSISIPHTPGTAGLDRAQAFSRPSTATQFGAHAPSYGISGNVHPMQVPYSRSMGGGAYDRPVATAPQYNGVTPYHVYPYANRYESHTLGGGSHAYTSSPAYHAPTSSFGGNYGSHFGGAGGGGFHAPTVSSPSYSHSYSHGGGGHGGGHGGHR